MMLYLVLAMVCYLLAAGIAFWTGLRVGSRPSTVDETLLVQLRADQARRQMHDMTRAAFVAMAEEAESKHQRR